ncbi:uncharacterized protein K452DRAFT_361541 [Aplosporella prunicola CBS 121167]|uniref:Uncharacterized protein n=1 Tax=Aplosporella prunicola CBS 121167 TaxID=1176127 RepID=A0A6A6B525_9PEZI|nr:uncharacterized protein K452DRAFT_361541 [Aplosporella prunicola CBS 121167]KAF2138067.1 hypothetical protein K452DRAFT_361541 [Aplosporella prunicola CBS 121167]
MPAKTPISVLLLGLLGAVHGQVTYNGESGIFTCATASGAYCSGDSLSSNIIIRCSGGVGIPGNCNDNLAGITPVGVKTSALCYQTSPTAGDAVCSFNNVGYPGNAAAFAIANCNTPSNGSVSTQILSAPTIPAVHVSSNHSSSSTTTKAPSDKTSTSTLTRTSTNILTNTEIVDLPTTPTPTPSGPSVEMTTGAATRPGGSLGFGFFVAFGVADLLMG